MSVKLKFYLGTQLSFFNTKKIKRHSDALLIQSCQALHSQSVGSLYVSVEVDNQVKRGFKL